MDDSKEQALFERLRRQLKREGQQLHRCRVDSKSFLQLGRYYVTDDHNRLLAGHVDLAEWLEVA